MSQINEKTCLVLLTDTHLQNTARSKILDLSLDPDFPRSIQNKFCVKCTKIYMLYYILFDLQLLVLINSDKESDFSIAVNFKKSSCH